MPHAHQEVRSQTLPSTIGPKRPVALRPIRRRYRGAVRRGGHGCDAWRPGTGRRSRTPLRTLPPSTVNAPQGGVHVLLVDATAQDFITAIQRLYDKGFPSPGQVYSDLIAGARRFGAGKASHISGLRASDADTLQITLDQPAETSCPSSPFRTSPGARGVRGRIHRRGQLRRARGRLRPHKVDTYIPGRRIVLVRNPNWDAATDPLRKAWVDRTRSRPTSPSRRSNGRSSGRRPTCRWT